MDLRMMIELVRKIREMRSRETWDRKLLEDHQAHALKKIREFAYANSPFYQRFHKGLSHAPLSELPILTKAMVMDHFDQLVTDRAIHLRDIQAHVARSDSAEQYLGRYVINVTSGSSGKPGVFVYDRSEWAAILAAGYSRLRDWEGMKLSLQHRTRIASIASTSPYHMSAQGGSTVQKLLMPELQLAASDPVPAIVDRLNGWQPQLLTVYASMGRILAEEQVARRLRIAPRLVIVGSEVLTQETRRLMVEAWGERIFNNYACTEAGGIATECAEHRGMHVWEDLLIVEVVDGDNRPVPPGVFGGKLLITALFKRAQPLIRYQVEDSVRLAAESCPCGRPHRLIDSVQGRVMEILRFPGVAGTTVSVHPIAFHAVMDTLPASGWQIVQQAGGLRVFLSGVHGHVDEARLSGLLEKVLVSQGVAAPRITVERVAAIPKSIAGKTPLIRAEESTSRCSTA
jgi:putative adenylate-forming enzyme